MNLKLAIAALVLCPSGAEAATQLPPLRNPAVLNIGFVCRWQDRCIQNQQKAMRHSLKFVAQYEPPTWRIQLCNRNAARNGTRVDWVGFNNCIRNPDLRPPPPKPAPKVRKRRR